MENTSIIISVLSSLIMCCILLSSIIGIGYLNREYVQNQVNLLIYGNTIKQIKRKEITCRITKDPDSMQCIDIENDNDYITITDGILAHPSYTDEQNKNGKELRYYYITIPYNFVIDRLIMLNNGEIVINNIDDLYKFLNDSEIEAKKTLEKLNDKCLGVKVDIRDKSSTPYNTLCTFYSGGFSKIDSLSELFKTILLNKIPKDTIDQYYYVLIDKITSTKSLTLFEYIIYIAIYKYNNQDKYKYVSLCYGPNSVDC